MLTGSYLSRQPSHIIDVTEFRDAIRLFYGTKEVADYNRIKLDELGQPVACINARHSSTAAKNISTNEMSGLEPVIYLAKEARVMLTMNLWPSVGLCNGATGKVVDIIYQNGHQPPDLPVAVIVQFDDYKGPSISETIPSCVPICPITISSGTSTKHERQKLPLRLAWALTTHKSQGLTLSNAWINIGKTESALGLAYIAISRVKMLRKLVIEPMTFERLAKIGSSSNLQFRIAEEIRVDKLAQSIYSTYHQSVLQTST